jgi:hypothetical protein
MARGKPFFSCSCGASLLCDGSSKVETYYWACSDRSVQFAEDLTDATCLFWKLMFIRCVYLTQFNNETVPEALELQKVSIEIRIV